MEKQYPSLSKKERDRKVKEKILELYLNYIFLGNNSYGVQAASKSYFG
jgi:penicillin-binding protein 1A